MVTQIAPAGLVATSSAELTTALDNLLKTCGWPLVVDATPRRLAREFSRLDPECVLFWLESRAALASTAELVSWARQRGPRPYRAVVAYQQDADVEPTLRAAGAHAFLSVGKNDPMTVVDALLPLLDTARASPVKKIPRSPPRTIPSELVRPP